MKKYLTQTIEDWGGQTSSSYKKFQSDYKKELNKICRSIGCELVRFLLSNHYGFSCFVKNHQTDKFAYISISDVRYWRNQWYNSILIRTAEHEKDYKGGHNHYTTYNDLAQKILQITK